MGWSSLGPKAQSMLPYSATCTIFGSAMGLITTHLGSRQWKG